MPLSRTFTTHDLIQGITTAQFEAMSPEDQAAFNQALLDLWTQNARTADYRHLAGDDDLIGSYRRSDHGQ